MHGVMPLPPLQSTRSRSERGSSTNRPAGGTTISVRARAHAVVHPVRHAAVVDALHGDLVLAVGLGRARERVAAHEHAPRERHLEAQELPGAIGERLGERGRHLEHDRERVVGLGNHARHAQRDGRSACLRATRRRRCPARSAPASTSIMPGARSPPGCGDARRSAAKRRAAAPHVSRGEGQIARRARRQTPSS